jgi:hypothetical protein
LEHDGLNHYTLNFSNEMIRLSVDRHGLVIILFEKNQGQ